MSAACALDTVPLLGQRVINLLSWGRRMTVVSRYLEAESLDVKVGLTVDHEQGDRAISLRTEDHYASFGVHLAPGIEGFSFAAFGSDGNATEAEVWKRYHSGEKKREITTVELIGGGDGALGPGREDHITITYWNQHGVGRQTVVGFDTNAFYEVWLARENQGWLLGKESLDVAYCKQFAQVGRYRVSCAFPLAGAACSGADDHVAAVTRPSLSEGGEPSC